jgi:predicted transcriptional regulator
MARTTVKATYSLAPEVVARLERLAAGWKVSKSEALSRAIRSAEEQSSGVSSFDALDALQTGYAMTPAAAAGWMDEVRAQRQELRQELRQDPCSPLQPEPEAGR